MIEYLKEGEECPECEGTGKITADYPRYSGAKGFYVQHKTEDCPACEGSGTLPKLPQCEHHADDCMRWEYISEDGEESSIQSLCMICEEAKGDIDHV